MTQPSFGTAFDEPVPALRLPAVVDSGSDPALQLVDGVYRGDGLIGRLTNADAMVGLKVEPPAGGSIRVTVALSMDNASLKWWNDRVPAEVLPRRAGGARLIRLLSQAEPRAVTLLRRRASDSGREDTRAVVEFDLPAHEIDPDGLLVIELRSLETKAYAGLPAGVSDAIAPHSAVGLRIDSIALVPSPGPARPHAAHLTGGHQPPARPARFLRHRATGELPVRPGFFVATAGVWTLRAVFTGPDRRLRYKPPKPLLFRVRRKLKRVIREALPASARPFARRMLRRWERLGGRVRGLAPRPRRATATVPATTAPAPVRQRTRLTDLLTQPLIAGRVRAEAFGLDAGVPVPVELTPGGLGRVVVRPAGPLTGPVLVRLSGPRGVLGRHFVGWRVTAEDHGVPPVHRPSLDPGDGAANHARLTRLLSRPAGVLELPAGRYPLRGGLVVGDGWTVAGGPTVLVQDEAGEQPLVQVLGSHVALRNLRFELPVVSSGPHDGAGWTAVTVGRYFYPETASWQSDVQLDDLEVVRDGRCTANAVTVIGAVSGVRVSGLSVIGGGTGLMVHWGGVGTGVAGISGPTYHPNRLAIERLTVTSAYEGFCLSSVHDVTVRGVRCDEVEIGFRLLAGDNADRFHPHGPGSEVGSRITVDGCDLGWCGDLYAVRVAGWGRSEVDGLISHRTFTGLRLTACDIRPLPVTVDPARSPRTTERTPVVLERSGPVDLTGITLSGHPVTARDVRVSPAAAVE